MRLPSTASRVASSGACHSISSSKVRLASSIMAHSSPGTSTSTRRSSLPSSGRPSALARRRAGSIVSTATFLPRAAMPSAMAAEVVVLPTPPEPAQMQTSLRSSQVSITARAPTGATAAHLGRPQVGLEEEGEAHHRRPALAAKALDLVALLARPPVLGQGGGAAGAASGGREVAVQGGQLPRLLGLEAVGQDAVDDGGVDVHAHVLFQAGAQVDRLVHRHLLGQRHRDHAGGARVGDEVVDPPRLLGDRAHAGDLRVGARGAQEGHAVSGGRSVDDGQVVRPRAAHPSLELGQVPDLADRHELVDPGRGGGQVLEDAAAAEQAGQRRGLELIAQPLLLGLDRIDGDPVQPVGEPSLAVAERATAEQLGQALLLGHLGHAPCASRRGRRPAPARRPPWSCPRRPCRSRR